MSIRFGYTGDLHLEFLDYPDFSKEPGGDILLLAGDILTAYAIVSHRTDKEAKKLKKYLVDKFKPTLLDKYQATYMVMGNHEHYNSIFKNTKQMLRNSFQELGLSITILDNDTVDLNGVHLIGSTLWSDFENGSPESMVNCQFGMNDFRIIGTMDTEDFTYFNRYDSRILTPEYVYREHKQSVEYIRFQLDRLKGQNVVVMTHHGPTYKSLHRDHVGNALNGAYASDLSDMILSYPNIRYWISSHTHYHQDYDVGHTNMLSNPRGYRGEKSYNIWNGVKHFDV